MIVLANLITRVSGNRHHTDRISNVHRSTVNVMFAKALIVVATLFMIDLTFEIAQTATATAVSSFAHRAIPSERPMRAVPCRAVIGATARQMRRADLIVPVFAVILSDRNSTVVIAGGRTQIVIEVIVEMAALRSVTVADLPSHRVIGRRSMKRAARPGRGIAVGRIDGGMHQPIVELIASVVRAAT